jgi:hypothetical protein
MRIPSLMLAAAMMIGPAKAEPVTLSCYGEMRMLGRAGVGQPPEKYSMPIVIDQEAKTITVDHYEPLALFGDTQGTEVAFIAKPGSSYGVSTGLLNRITGAASIHIFPLAGGVLGFEGICKPSKKLF